MNTITVTLPWFLQERTLGVMTEEMALLFSGIQLWRKWHLTKPKSLNCADKFCFPSNFSFLPDLSNESSLSNQQNIYSSKAVLLLLKMGPSQRWKQWNIYLEITEEGTAFCSAHMLSAVTDLFSILHLSTVISLLSTSQLPPFLLIQKTTWKQAEPTHSSRASPWPQTQGALHLPETYRERT